eukprot:SM000085S23287  [mRNA]  locus=s85:539070:539398:+ [translate_table: standard]
MRITRGRKSSFRSPSTFTGRWALVSLQRSMACALHLRAGRALAAASGPGQGTRYSETSFSDLRPPNWSY